MYQDPYQPRQGGLAQIMRLLSASFRLGYFFGVEVRVYWVTLVIMPLIIMPRMPGEVVERFTHTVITTGLLYVIIYAHEMSHIVAGRRFQMHTPLITLSPLGGTAHMATPAPNPRAEALVALAGPASHLVWLAVFAPLWFFFFRDRIELMRPDGWVLSPVWLTAYTLYAMNLALMLFNLLPFFPMDGGRTLRAGLAMKMHANRATMIATQAGIVGAVLFILAGLFGLGGSYGGILVALGISNWIACAQERRIAKYTPGPYDASARFEPWQVDPDAWRRSSAPDKPPGLLDRRRQQKADEKRRRDRQQAETLQADVDRILDKVNEVGMAGLSEKEKQILIKASKSKRR